MFSRFVMGFESGTSFIFRKFIFGVKLDKARKLTANYFTSTCLIFENGRYKEVELPTSIQLSSINAIAADYVDIDGAIDLIIGGNLFHSEAETP